MLILFNSIEIWYIKVDKKIFVLRFMFLKEENWLVLYLNIFKDVNNICG